MNIQKLVGFSGAAVMALGAFLPIVSLPIVGSLNYFNNGEGDGIFIVILAVVAAVLTFLGQYKFLWIPGALSLAFLTFALVRFMQVVNEAKADLTSSLIGNPFAGLAEGLMGAVQLQWGWLVLFMGAMAITAAPFVGRISPKNSEQ